MAESSTTRPGIDPTMQALLGVCFRVHRDDGVEVAREQTRLMTALHR